jgi:hypothetical protein
MSFTIFNLMRIIIIVITTINSIDLAKIIIIVIAFMMIIRLYFNYSLLLIHLLPSYR